MTLDEAVARYGPIVNGVWANETQWCTMFQVPPDISQMWINTVTKQPTTHLYCNKDLAKPLAEVLRNIRDRGLISELRSFDGCLEIRDVRAEPGKPSAHSYGLAIDINAATNQLGTIGDMSFGLGECFVDEGLYWGRNFKRRDPMHFSVIDW